MEAVEAVDGHHGTQAESYTAKIAMIARLRINLLRALRSTVKWCGFDSISEEN